MRSKAELEAAIRDRKEAVLVVNPGSRTGRLLADTATQRFREHGLRLTALRVLRPGEPIESAVRAALHQCPDLVVVASGDGGISRAAGALAHADAALGVLPTGTTNNVARSLGIPLDLDGALGVLAGGRVADVDLGRVGDAVFANVASIGLTVQVAQRVPRLLKRYVGRFAYVLTGVAALAAHRSFAVLVERGEERTLLRTHQLIVANGSHHGGSPIADDASIDDDLLAVFHLGDHSRVQLLRRLRLLLRSRPRTLREGEFLLTNRARITTEPPQDVELDGEVRARTPIDVTIDRNALRVVVPAGFVDG